MSPTSIPVHDTTIPGSLKTVVDSWNSESQPAATPLRKEARTLSMLLTLVTAINNSDHPTLLQSFREKYENVPGANQSNRGTALNAIATILVRNTEVVAAAAHHPQSPPKPLEDLNVVAMQERDEPDEDDYVAGFHSREFSTVTNPDHRDNLTVSGHCVLVDPGKSHWPTICEGKWQSLEIGSRDPLQNHIATICGYINDFRMANPVRKEEIMPSFSEYVIATCWKKMLKQITHWSSEGFIANIVEYPERQLRAAFYRSIKTMFFSRRKDFALCYLIKSLPLDCSASPWFQHLQIFSDKMTCSNEQEIECSVEVFIGFHDLVVNTLLCYHKALKTFSVLMEKMDEDSHQGGANTKEDDADMLLNYVTLLWRITHSRILRRYLAALESESLGLPIESQAKEYNSIILERSGGKDEREREGLKEVGTATEGLEETEVEEEMELQQLVGLGGAFDKTSKDAMYRRWMHLQVSHLAALNILSTFSERSRIDQDVKISLIAMNYSRPDITTSTVESWEQTIKNLGPRLASESDSSGSDSSWTVTALAAIEIIQERINGGSKRPIFASFRNMNAAFKSISTEKFTFPGNLHCEAALASLVKYPKLAIADIPGADNTALNKLVHGLNTDSISVSKLCCPSCWELLDILKDETTKFNVRGCHATVYAVDFPPWLPDDVLERIVSRFRKLLHSELTAMVNEATQSQFSAGGYSCSLSLQSNSGFSSTSSTSDASAAKTMGWRQRRA